MKSILIELSALWRRRAKTTQIRLMCHSGGNDLVRVQTHHSYSAGCVGRGLVRGALQIFFPIYLAEQKENLSIQDESPTSFQV